MLRYQYVKMSKLKVSKCKDIKISVWSGHNTGSSGGRYKQKNDSIDLSWLGGGSIPIWGVEICWDEVIHKCRDRQINDPIDCVQIVIQPSADHGLIRDTKYGITLMHITHATSAILHNKDIPPTHTSSHRNIWNIRNGCIQLLEWSKWINKENIVIWRSIPISLDFLGILSHHQPNFYLWVSKILDHPHSVYNTWKWWFITQLVIIYSMHVLKSQYSDLQHWLFPYKQCFPSLVVDLVTGCYNGTTHQSYSAIIRSFCIFSNVTLFYFLMQYFSIF